MEVKGKLSEVAVVFNRTVKYEDPSVRQTVATLICLSCINGGCRISASGREECWG